MVICSWAFIVGFPMMEPKNSYSSFVKHSGFRYRKSLLSFSFRASHPQSMPVASVNHSTAALMPVAVVIFSMVSPRPLLRLLPGFVGLFAIGLYFLSSIV